MTAEQGTDGEQRVHLTGPVIDEPGFAGRLGDTLAAAGVRGRQALELIASAVRGVAAALRVSALAGLAAALVITLVWDPAFGMRWWKALILLGVLALPGLEVLAHRAVLSSLWGDAKRLENRGRAIGGSVIGGADDFAQRMTALRDPGAAVGGRGGRGRAGIGAARSALGLRDVLGLVPGVTGLLLFPLRKGLLALTAICTALCWVLLVVGVPVAVLVGIGAALAR